MAKRKQEYGNESISMLEGADRVRKRPGVIFGSDGLEGCEHAVFEILSNAIDEAREGFGKEIVVTHFRDGRIQVEAFGRGCPVDWNEKVGKYNWELVFCELYAGGKYDNNGGDNYEYSLGLNGLGACATQYTARFMDVIVRRDGKRYDLHFEKGQLIGEMKVSPAARKKTGTTITWLPDLEVFTQTDIPDEYFKDVLHRQAVVNAGITFRFKTQAERGFDETTYVYENGIADYVAELAGEHAHTPIQFWTGETSPTIKSSSPAPSASARRRIPSSITTTLPGWSTAAPPKRPCARPSSPPWTGGSSKTANTTRPRPRSPGPTSRRPSSSSPTTSPPRPLTRTRPKRPSTTASSRRA